jgi:hypothetical protein
MAPGVYIAVLDPELIGTAALLLPPVTREDVLRLISMLPDNRLRTAGVIIQGLARRERRVRVWRRSEKLTDHAR